MTVDRFELLTYPLLLNGPSYYDSTGETYAPAVPWRPYLKLVYDRQLRWRSTRFRSLTAERSKLQRQHRADSETYEAVDWSRLTKIK